MDQFSPVTCRLLWKAIWIFCNFFQLTDVKDQCHPNPCKNNGICYDRGSKYKCKCVGDFVGKNCESKFLVILYNVKDIKVK